MNCSKIERFLVVVGGVDGGQNVWEIQENWT